MSDRIDDRIAEVLRQKQVAFRREGEVAAAIVAVLELTEEWGVGYREFDGISGVIPREGKTDAEILNMEHRYDDRQGYSVVSRHVTKWLT